MSADSSVSGEGNVQLVPYLKQLDGDVKRVEGRVERVEVRFDRMEDRFDRFEIKIEGEIRDLRDDMKYLRGEVQSGHQLLLGEIQNIRREVKGLKNRPFSWPRGMAMILLGTNVFLIVVVFEVLWLVHS